jgi:hypothetical protein
VLPSGKAWFGMRRSLVMAGALLLVPSLRAALREARERPASLADLAAARPLHRAAQPGDTSAANLRLDEVRR